MSEGRWRPSPDRFPLRIGANQRLLLLAPNDLTQLAREVTTHPLSYALAASGQLSADQLAGHLKFECLIEVDLSGHLLFNAAVAGAPLPANQSVLILNESLSRELMDLALLAPPAAAPAPANATASAAGPQPVDLSALADPIAVAPSPAVPPTQIQAPKPVPSASAPAQTANPAPVATPPLIELPPLVFKFLEYVQSLNPRDIHTADKAGQPRPGKNATPEHIQIDLQLISGIRLGRPLIQRFAKTHAYPLDTVFTTLIGCPQVIEHTEPLPPQPTLWLTMSLPASKAVYNQELSKFARTAATPVHSVAAQAPRAPSSPVVQPSTAMRSQPADSSPDFADALTRLRALPATPAPTMAPLPYLHSLLLRVLAYPSVSSRLVCPSTTKTAFVPFDSLPTSWSRHAGMAWRKPPDWSRPFWPSVFSPSGCRWRSTQTACCSRRRSSRIGPVACPVRLCHEISHEVQNFWRPAYEFVAALVWFAAALVYLGIGRRFDGLIAYSGLLSIPLTGFGFYRLAQAMRIWNFKCRLWSPSPIFSTVQTVLAKQKKRGALWLGWGFTWEPIHAKRLRVISSLDEQQTKPPPSPTCACVNG